MWKVSIFVILIKENGLILCIHIPEIYVFSWFFKFANFLLIFGQKCFFISKLNFNIYLYLIKFSFSVKICHFDIFLQLFFIFQDLLNKTYRAQEPVAPMNWFSSTRWAAHLNGFKWRLRSIVESHKRSRQTRWNSSFGNHWKIVHPYMGLTLLEAFLIQVYLGIWQNWKRFWSKYNIFDDWFVFSISTSKGLDGQKIPGVTNPYVYVGSWKTMFGWHKEDMDLYSINYLHHGSPKFWYGVDLRDNRLFEDFMHRIFPDSSRRCEEFIRHKTTLV